MVGIPQTPAEGGKRVMDYKIVTDSGCDMYPELKERLGVTAVVPLTIMLGDREFVDDESLDRSKLVSDMKACTEKVGSASPPPVLYADAFCGERTSFAVTLSKHLSGSYASAILGKSIAEEDGGADVHVFDSKSASAGEVLLTVKLREMIDKGLNKTEIIEAAQEFIDNIKTYFVLDCFDNLLKNGRLNKITGGLITALGIKLVMGSDGDGNIKLFSKVRGQNSIIDKLTSLIGISKKTTEGESIVISHCNNLELAQKLANTIKKHFRFKEILIVPTSGLCSLYADDKGIIMAF